MTRLKFQRLNFKLSQAQVALLADIPQPEVSQIERGRIVPTHEELQRLAAIFDLTPTTLLDPVGREQ